MGRYPIEGMIRMNKRRMPKAGYKGPLESTDLLSGALLVADDQDILVDLLDDVTGNTVIGYKADGTTASGKPVLAASSAVTARRGSGNHVRSSWGSSALAYIEIVFATALDLSKQDYLGFWRYSDTAFAAADYYYQFFDAEGLQIGANIDCLAADALCWQFEEIDITGVSRRHAIAKMRIVELNGDNDVVEYESMIAYKYGNGRGPIHGLCVQRVIETGPLTRGMAVYDVPGKTTVAELANNGTAGTGIVVVGGATGEKATILIMGTCYNRCLGTGVTLDDPISGTATSCVFDDDATAGRSIGRWRETIATTLSDILCSIAPGLTAVNAGGITVTSPANLADLDGTALLVFQCITSAGTASYTIAHGGIKVRVLDVWFRNNAAGGSSDTITIKNGSTAITDVMDANKSDLVLTRAATIDGTQRDIAAGGTLVVATASGATADVYILAAPVA